AAKSRAFAKRARQRGVPAREAVAGRRGWLAREPVIRQNLLDQLDRRLGTEGEGIGTAEEQHHETEKSEQKGSFAHCAAMTPSSQRRVRRPALSGPLLRSGGATKPRRTTVHAAPDRSGTKRRARGPGARDCG